MNSVKLSLVLLHAGTEVYKIIALNFLFHMSFQWPNIKWFKVMICVLYLLINGHKRFNSNKSRLYVIVRFGLNSLSLTNCVG